MKVRNVTEDLGKIVYNAFTAYLEWHEPTPFEEMDQRVREAWNAGAEALAQHLKGE